MKKHIRRRRHGRAHRCFRRSRSCARSDPANADWPMWGGTPDRNMVSSMKGLPTTWDIKAKKNVKWVAELGSQTYGNPVVANGIVLVGTNNEAMRGSERQGRQGRPDGVPRVGRPVPLAGGARQAGGRAGQRLAVPGHLLVAAGRERHGLLRLQSRRADGGRHRRVPRRHERRAGQGREVECARPTST